MFDKNDDEKISLQEFQIVLKNMIIQEMLTSEDLVIELKNEFSHICNPNTYELDPSQVQQMFYKFGIDLRQKDVLALFAEIDTDKSGLVDLEEFISFLQKPFNQISDSTKEILLTVKGAKKLTLKDLRQMFELMPDNFFVSFLRGANRRFLNLPSSFLQPTLDETALLYHDCVLINAQKYDLDNPLLEEKKPEEKKSAEKPKANQEEAVKNKVYQFEIKLIKSEGIPIPSDSKTAWSSLWSREVGICLYDRIRNDFYGNAIYCPCQWSAQEPDIWVFKPVYPVILNFTDFYEKSTQLDLIFEFVVHIEKNQSLNPISVAYGWIPFENLKLGEVYIINLIGGSPNNNLNINPGDVDVGGGFFRSFSKSKIKPTMHVSLSKTIDKETSRLLGFMPQNYLCPKLWLKLILMFREFMAFKSVEKGYTD